MMSITFQGNFLSSNFPLSFLQRVILSLRKMEERLKMIHKLAKFSS